jgi:hypothetical protein
MGCDEVSEMRRDRLRWESVVRRACTLVSSSKASGWLWRMYSATAKPSTSLLAPPGHEV